MTASVEASQTAGETRTSRRAVVRVVCWVLLVGSALVALWGTPRMASQDEMAKAVKAGDVRMVETDPGRYSLEIDLPNLNTTAADALVVVWQDGSGRLHRTDLSQLATGVPSTDGGATDVAATINATADAAGVAPPTYVGIGPVRFAAVPLALVVFAGFLLLVFGRQPRRVTKWGMFWLLTIPLGVGAGWWLWRDAPFNAEMAAAREPAPRQRGMTPVGVPRAGGGKTFFLAWAAAIGMAIVLAIVIGVQSSSNGSSQPTVPWTLVPAAGSAQQ
jgi:hypothetical protein